MNETTHINSELLSADSRGRKHIPVAVFAVIMIHIVLFVVLLIAAGCRSSARAKRNLTPAPETAKQQAISQPAIAPVAALEAQTPAAETESVMATEPVVEPEPAPRIQQRQASQAPRPAAKPAFVRATTRSTRARDPKIYVVKTGDTLEKIAKNHGTTIQAVRTANKIKNDRIHPGQKLHLSPEASAPLQVRSDKQKRSNEV